MSVPQELLSSIPEHETILYISKKLGRKRKKRIRQIVYIIGYIAIVTFFLSLLGPTTLSDILNGELKFWDIILFILTFIFPIFIFPLFFPLFERMFKREEYFLITDNHLLLEQLRYLKEKYSKET
jgi:O-antigen/teichoic acid export membrane protein